MGEEELVSFGFSILDLDQTLIVLILGHLHCVVRGIIEETLNSYLASEADRICGASRHERNAHRKDSRAGIYKRALSTIFGKLNLKVPKLRRLTLPVTVIDRLQSQQELIEQGVVKMYLTGASNSSVEALTAALLGPCAQPEQRTDFAYRVRASIDAWQNQYIGYSPRAVSLDVVDIERLSDEGAPNAKLLVARAINADGRQKVLGIRESNAASECAVSKFLRDLSARGLEISQTLTPHGRHQMHA